MKVRMECIPCFFKQILRVCNECDFQDLFCMDIMKSVSNIVLKDENLKKTPPEVSWKMYEKMREITGVKDPYENIKRRLNEDLLNLEGELRKRILESDNPILMGLKFAIAGNVIDFGAKDGVRKKDVISNLERVLHFNPDGDTFLKFLKDLKKSNKIMYIGDNAGEIVFDKLFIEQLPFEKITYVVRGEPIINDITMEDANYVGITNLVNVIDTGNGIPGVVPHLSSDIFLKAYKESDLIISKGQGNFETLESENKNIYFLFQAKCPVIANYIGLPLNEFVFFNTL